MSLRKGVFVVGGARTPIGSFLGKLSTFPAWKLGGMAIRKSIQVAGISPNVIEYGIVGQVLQAGSGQAPQRQALLEAGIPKDVDVHHINKVCSSGMKAMTSLGAEIELGTVSCGVACGMESMSTTPYVLTKARSGGYKLGHGSLIDLLIHDGLWDPYNNIHMGECAEKTVRDFKITRGEQDEYAIESYKRASDAWKSGIMEKECNVTVTVKASRSGEKGVEISEDEEYSKLKLDKVATLKSAFIRDGTITAFNSSKINDGAASVVLMSESALSRNDAIPLARIVSYADVAVDPIDFPTSPSLAIKKALKLAGIPQADFYEINEAFSAVVLANMKILGLDHSVMNVHGGAVALGHPLGMSGLRIVLSLMNVLKTRKAEYGVAAICNGGGGGSAVVIQNIS